MKNALATIYFHSHTELSPQIHIRWQMVTNPLIPARSVSFILSSSHRWSCLASLLLCNRLNIHLKSTQNKSRSLFIIIWQFLWHPRSMGNHQILQNMQENVCTELFQNYILGHKGNNGDGGCLWLSENCCFSKQIMGSNFVCRQTSRERSNCQIEYKHVSMGFYGKRFPAKKQILCGGRCLIFFAESWLTSMGNFATTSRDRFKCWNRIYKHLSNSSWRDVSPIMTKCVNTDRHHLVPHPPITSRRSPNMGLHWVCHLHFSESQSQYTDHVTVTPLVLLRMIICTRTPLDLPSGHRPIILSDLFDELSTILSLKNATSEFLGLYIAPPLTLWWLDGWHHQVGGFLREARNHNLPPATLPLFTPLCIVLHGAGWSCMVLCSSTFHPPSSS